MTEKPAADQVTDTPQEEAAGQTPKSRRRRLGGKPNRPTMAQLLNALPDTPAHLQTAAANDEEPRQEPKIAAATDPRTAVGTGSDSQSAAVPEVATPQEEVEEATAAGGPGEGIGDSGAAGVTAAAVGQDPEAVPAGASVPAEQDAARLGVSEGPVEGVQNMKGGAQLDDKEVKVNDQEKRGIEGANAGVHHRSEGAHEHAGAEPRSAPKTKQAGATAGEPVRDQALQASAGTAAPETRKAAGELPAEIATERPGEEADDDDGETTHRVSVYITSEAAKAARRTGLSRGTVSINAVDAALNADVLADLIRIRQVGSSATAPSRFPPRKATRRAPRRAQGASNRVLWQPAFSDAELGVLDGIRSEVAAETRSELVSVAVEWYMMSPEKRAELLRDGTSSQMPAVDLDRIT
ncbi:hypothetical protein SUDANB95_07950 (plasmid) [Actinosynnema sp. ALI-1.44]